MTDAMSGIAPDQRDEHDNVLSPLVAVHGTNLYERSAGVLDTFVIDPLLY